jgi:hypothetical protein
MLKLIQITLRQDITPVTMPLVIYGIVKNDELAILFDKFVIDIFVTLAVEIASDTTILPHWGNGARLWSRDGWYWLRGWLWNWFWLRDRFWFLDATPSTIPQVNKPLLDLLDCCHNLNVFLLVYHTIEMLHLTLVSNTCPIGCR